MNPDQIKVRSVEKEKPRAPVILAKKSHQGPLRGEGGGKLWAPESERASSVASAHKHGIPLILQSGELPQSQYKIQQKSSVPTRAQASSAKGDWTRRDGCMSSTTKLVDEYLNWHGNSLQQYLLDEELFRVVGVIGLEGSGKSYILNLLNNKGNCERLESQTDLFGMKGKERYEYAGWRTCGLDVHIGSGRTVLIDCQPLMCSHILEDIMHWGPERKNPALDKYKDYKECEVIAEHMDIELVMFLLSVCHIVLVVEDSSPNPNLHRLLQTAEMLRPNISDKQAQEESPTFPAKVIFVQNKCDRVDSLSTTQDIETSIYRLYTTPVDQSQALSRPQSQSETRKPGSSLIQPKLKIQYRVKGSRVTVLKVPLRSTKNPAEIPDILHRYERNFVEEIMRLKIDNLTESNLTERDWLLYAAKVWEAGSTTSFLSEFTRSAVNQFSDHYKD